MYLNLAEVHKSVETLTLALSRNTLQKKRNLTSKVSLIILLSSVSQCQ